MIIKKKNSVKKYKLTLAKPIYHIIKEIDRIFATQSYIITENLIIDNQRVRK